MKIGARTVCLRWDWGRTLAFCKEIGLDGFQVAPTEHGLVDLSETEQRELGDRVRSMGLEISATSGGPNLVDPQAAEESVGKFRSFLRLAVNLGPGIVSAEVKAVPQGMDMEDAWKSCSRSVRAVCEYAEEVGGTYAVEPGPHCLVKDGDTILRLIETVDHPRLKVNYDPANVNSSGADAVADAERVASHIIHTHAKDSQRTPDGPKETILGSGDVDFPKLIQTYADAGFDGWLCIERECGDSTADDIKFSKDFLEQIVKKVEAS